MSEITAEAACAQVAQLRDVTAILVAGLLVVVGFIAYWLGLFIVRPLDRLTKAAPPPAQRPRSLARSTSLPRR